MNLDQDILPEIDLKTGAAQISAETYQTLYSSPFEDSIFLRRDHFFANGAREIDCYGNFWSFVFSTLGPGQVFCKRLGKMIEISGHSAVWTPPYSVVDWNLKPGTLRWYGFMSKAQIPSDIPQKAMLISLPENFKIPKSSEEVFSLVRNSTNKIIIEKEEFPSAVSAKTKLTLQQTLGSNLSLAQIADQLGYSHAVMTRLFKKNFDISPVDYRSRCRIMESMVLLMLREKNVIEAGFEVGFEDCSAFFRQFKRQTQVSPSKFL
jgi:AraC-like DNA-binding protein